MGNKNQYQDKDLQVKFIKRDRGTDFNKLNSISNMIDNKYRNLINSVERDKQKLTKELTKQAFEFFKIQEIEDKINEYTTQAKELEKKAEELRDEIKKYTKTEDSRYGRYNEPSDGSKIDLYVKEQEVGGGVSFDELKTLKDAVQEKIWFATDIEEVRELYNDFDVKLQEYAERIKNQNKKEWVKPEIREMTTEEIEKFNKAKS